MTTLTVNIKDISQIAIIKKILKAFNVEVIGQNNEITNPELIQRLEKHHKNFQKQAYSGKNGQIDHQFPMQIDHQFRNKLTT